ncbi:hypothetical protein [Polaribacter cellanae]|uniref:Uncharacterized protein n=1 Tax=Polaribacter cellanae TaxID=2818493 RepID=A0A975CKM5_9FLAO|nr:hypothetical protein [Polaribacter cellanae]QTE21064.1 hypothetical protein J3359_09400 [Polaribacter cellanae]
MRINKRPKLRVSLYHYSDDFMGFLLAFRATAIKQGWTYQELQTVVFDQTENMTPFEMFLHLMQYAVIVKMPKSVYVRSGKIIQKNKKK